MIRALTTAGLTGLQQAIVKATFDDEQKPKPKHIRTIIDWVNAEYSGLGSTYNDTKIDLVQLLQKRITNQSWRVVLKTLILIHIIFRDCDANYMEMFSDYGDIKILHPCKSYMDSTSPSSIVHSTFIRKYSIYLLEKLSVFVKLKFNVEKKLDPKNKNFFQSYTPEKLGETIPKIMTQLNKMCEIQPTGHNSYEIDNISHEVMLLLIKDSLRLHPSIQLCLWELLSNFKILTLDQAKWINKTYNKYFSLNQIYQKWFDKCVRLHIIDYKYAPNFDTLPKSLCKTLESYIKEHEKTNKKSKKKKTDDYNDIEVGNLQDILDSKQLNEFESNAKKYREKKNDKKNKKDEPKVDDLLDFSNFNFDDNNSTTNKNNKINHVKNVISFGNDELFTDVSNWLESVEKDLNDEKKAKKNEKPVFDPLELNGNSNMQELDQNDTWWQQFNDEKKTTNGFDTMFDSNLNDNNNDPFSWANMDQNQTLNDKPKAMSGKDAKKLKKSNPNKSNDPFSTLIDWKQN